MVPGDNVWTIAGIVVYAVVQHLIQRWARAEQARLNAAADEARERRADAAEADREQRRTARVAAWAMKLNDASLELEAAIDAWRETVPTVYRGDPDARARVAGARGSPSSSTTTSARSEHVTRPVCQVGVTTRGRSPDTSSSAGSSSAQASRNSKVIMVGLQAVRR